MLAWAQHRDSQLPKGSADRFWLTDAQFAKIAPHLPTDTRGKARVDDRRVISGIVHVLKSGGRWIDDATLEIETYDAMSIWGHKAPAEPLLPGIVVPVEA